MRFIIISQDTEIFEAAKKGFHPSDRVDIYENWVQALDESEGVDLIFVDILSTLIEAHKIDGYEEFAHAKMQHPVADVIPLVLIGAGADYKLDFMVGWPNFLLGHFQRPIDYRQLRRASTWV